MELIIGKTYEIMVNQLIRGEMDFARLGPTSYVQTKNADSGIEIVAMELKRDTKVFYGITGFAEGGDEEYRVIRDTMVLAKSFGAGS